MKAKRARKPMRKSVGKKANQAKNSSRKREADVEQKAVKLLQKDISQGVEKYMAKEKIGFNELVRRLGASPTQTLRILRGEANLTMASVAHLAALFKKTPRLVFK